MFIMVPAFMLINSCVNCKEVENGCIALNSKQYDDSVINISIINSCEFDIELDEHLRLGYMGDPEINSYFVVYLHNGDSIIADTSIHYQNLILKEKSYITIGEGEKVEYDIDVLHYFPKLATLDNLKIRFWYKVYYNEKYFWVSSDILELILVGKDDGVLE